MFGRKGYVSTVMKQTIRESLYQWQYSWRLLLSLAFPSQSIFYFPSVSSLLSN